MADEVKTYRVPGLTVQVVASGKDKIVFDMKQMRKNLKDTTPVLRKWRKRYFKEIEWRFNNRGGVVPWKKGSLSMKSTIPLRTLEDITRIGTPPTYADRRLGGTPLKTLISRMAHYKNTWLKAGPLHHEFMRQDATAKRGALFMLINRSVKIVHEFGITSTGGPKGLRGKKVPKRSVAYIVGDRPLLQDLLIAFDEHIWKGIKAGGLKGMIRQAATGILPSGGGI